MVCYVMRDATGAACVWAPHVKTYVHIYAQIYEHLRGREHDPRTNAGSCTCSPVVAASRASGIAVGSIASVSPALPALLTNLLTNLPWQL
jgi:hypothetical protein